MKKYLLLIVAWGFSYQTWACSCATLTVEKRWEAYSTIALVRVIGVRNKTKHFLSSEGASREIGLQYKLRVQKRYKGEVNRTIKVFTPKDEAACGMRFSPRGVYVVFAYHSSGELETDLCSRNVKNQEPAFGGLQATLEKMAVP